MCLTVLELKHYVRTPISTTKYLDFSVKTSQHELVLVLQISNILFKVSDF